MAIETQGGLRCLVESLVTLGTGILPLGVSLDHLAWHQGGFDVACPGVTREEHPQPKDSDWSVTDERLHRSWSDSIHVDSDDVN